MILHLSNPSGILQDVACRPHPGGAAQKVHTVGACPADFRFWCNSCLATTALHVSALEMEQSIRDFDNRIDCV